MTSNNYNLVQETEIFNQSFGTLTTDNQPLISPRPDEDDLHEEERLIIEKAKSL